MTGVLSLIEVHRAAVAIDKTVLKSRGYKQTLAEKTLSVERFLFGLLVSEPCLSAAEAAAKAEYLLHGTIGTDEGLLNALIDGPDNDPIHADGPLVLFLKSLIPTDGASLGSQEACA